MNRNEVLFSSLTNSQIEELRALETKFSTQTNAQDTILIAYAKPK